MYIIRSLLPDIINILLVEDNNDDTLFFKRALRYQVFRTHLNRVSTGEEMLQLLNDETVALPDVIFLDINLPDKNGYECLMEIKESRRLEKIPVIMYSNAYNMNVADVIYELGANFYIIKPTESKNEKMILEKALCFVTENKSYTPTRENFVLGNHAGK